MAISKNGAELLAASLREEARLIARITNGRLELVNQAGLPDEIRRELVRALYSSGYSFVDSLEVLIASISALHSIYLQIDDITQVERQFSEFFGEALYRHLAKRADRLHQESESICRTIDSTLKSIESIKQQFSEANESITFVIHHPFPE